MGLGDTARTIYSPIATFERIRGLKPSFVDGLLFFLFVYTFSLGFNYAVLSAINVRYGLEMIIPFTIGIPAVLFLSSPGIMGFVLSMSLAFIEVLLLSLLFHGFSKYVNKGVGAFTTLFTLMSLSQIVTIFPVLISPLFGLISGFAYGFGFLNIFFMIGVLGYIVVTIFWRYLLYGFAIGVTHRIPEWSIVTSFILTFIAFFLIYPLIAIWFVKQVPTELLEIGRFGMLAAVETGIR